MTYKNGTKDITIEQCLEVSKLGVAIIFNDGKDVTFEIEEVGDIHVD